MIPRGEDGDSGVSTVVSAMLVGWDPKRRAR